MAAMLYLQANSLPIWAAILGLLSHWTYFIHGEHHMQAQLYFCIFVASIPVIYYVELRLHNYDSSDVIRAETEVFGAFLLSLFASMTIYRLFFHRLRHFKGPLGARISKIWHVWHVRHSQNHLVLDNLQQKYGTFVRTGEQVCYSWSEYVFTMLGM
jgi:tryprostatin B 6-hydroxylase